MPANWPDLTLAIGLALGAAYVISLLASRAVRSMLRTILPDDQEERFIAGPGRAIRFFLFLIVAAALSFPALSLAGYTTGFTRDRNAMMRWLLDGGLRIGVIALTAYLIIRIGSAAVRRFEREMGAGTGLNIVERTRRAQTLGRLIQKALTSVVSVIAGLMVLRELGADITPALTGFGIVGVAVGLGGQTLIRDIVSGFFMIVDDRVRVGDNAMINGQGGLVEEVNLRTIVLRDEQGTVHVYPNGEVRTLANMSKDFAYAVVSLGVSYDDDPERVVQVLHDAGASLMSDPECLPHILAPIEVFGIDAFEADRLVVKGRMQSRPQKQWLVGRELRKRIAALLRERGIQAPMRPITLVQATEQKRPT